MKKNYNTKFYIGVWCFVLFSLTFVLYANTLSNAFAFDDQGLIVNNKLLYENAKLPVVFSTNYRFGAGFYYDGLYRPLVILSYLFNYSKDLNPFPFHLTNVILNALNSILLFLLVYFLLGDLRCAVFTSLLFSFHPVHTESVANISGRPEIMCTFFILLSWIFLDKADKYPWRLLAGVLFLFCALLTKEIAIVFPFMILITDVITKKTYKEKRMILKYVFIMITLAIYLIIRWQVLGDMTAMRINFVDNPIALSPISERIPTALSVFLRYIFLLVFPLKLSSDYSYNQLPIYTSIFNFIPLIAIFIIIAIFALSFFAFFKWGKPAYLLSLVFFFFPYIIFSNIFFPIGTIMGERLMYLPSIGFVLIFGYICSVMFTKWKKITIFLTIVILSLFSVKTISRNSEWHDNYTLFSADVFNSPNSVKILHNLAFEYNRKKLFIESERYYHKALEIYPEHTNSLQAIGKQLYDNGKYEESAVYYKKAIKSSPKTSIIHYNYGHVLVNMRRFDEAKKEFNVAIRLNPASPLPYLAMGNLLTTIENYNDAIIYYEQAMEHGGDKQKLLNNMAAASYFLEEYDKAYDYIKKAEILRLKLNQDLLRSIKNKINKK